MIQSEAPARKTKNHCHLPPRCRGQRKHNNNQLLGLHLDKICLPLIDDLRRSCCLLYCQNGIFVTLLLLYVDVDGGFLSTINYI